MSHDCHESCKELAALKGREEIYKQALEKIAKPALGGKQQQWIAAEALAQAEGKGERE